MRARHVLVPLVVLGLAAELFLWRDPAAAPIVELSDDVNACAANLRQVYAALVRYESRAEHVPTEPGVRFLGALFASGALEPAERACLSCPGPGAERVPAEVDYRDLAALTGAGSAYAARDTVAFPLAKFPAGGPANEPLAACDNARGLNHAGCMNVLYSDGSVVTLSLAQEIEAGRLPAGTSTIPVGKDSPIPDLRKLSQD
jgi:hypothetical protein